MGGWLVIEGWPKLMNPMAQVGFVEMVGFHPGWFFSPLLAVAQVLGGIAIVLGLYTRPFAFACAFMMAVTVYFHLHFPYNAGALLTPEGIAAIKATPALVTPNGAKRLADGGLVLVDLTQHKALQLSSLWLIGCLVFAAFGGGPLSMDRSVLKRTF